MVSRRQSKTVPAACMLLYPLFLFSACRKALPDNVIPIAEATGSTLTMESLLKESKDALFDICDFGAKDHGDPLANTIAINKAIEAAQSAGGGTVIVPEGDYSTYTIHLRSDVNFRIEENGVIRAAVPDHQTESANYDEPEVNHFAGLQDHGHTYFANSLFYANGQKNILIYGNGMVDGSQFDDSGNRIRVLSSNDPAFPEKRSDPGHDGTWFGNKGFALVNCENVMMDGISIRNGGHFAVIAEGVTNFLVNDLTVDTNRDALNIDCCLDVTVRNSRFNSLTDDAIVLKSSYGAGRFMPVHNVVIEDCIVSGYDAGSVLDGTFTTEKLVAADLCGPTGRIKCGTESTCGYDTILIRRCHFERSRGFALEAVDGSPLHDVIMTDCTMENISSSPIFIRVGDRGRFPVTGHSADETLYLQGDVRLDHPEWILPNQKGYPFYPVTRYTPSYNKNHSVSVDGITSFSVVDPMNPAAVNETNLIREDGSAFLYRYDAVQKTYVKDTQQKIDQTDEARYANASGAAQLASVYNIEISNLTVKDADPRYPILLAGLVDSRIRNVKLTNIDVQFRGGLSLKEAVEQRQAGTWWVYEQDDAEPLVQNVPWLVNPFFTKAEGLLPRVRYDKDEDVWKEDPYNVPELPFEYPEPSFLGILPAYGFYARHTEGLVMEGVRFSFLQEDGRPAIVLDDTVDTVLHDVLADSAEDCPELVHVTNHYKRHTGMEYLPEEPYFTTGNSGLKADGLKSEEVVIDCPAPGTPADQLYPDIKLPLPENGYTYEIPTEDYPLPLTVFRPFFRNLHSQTITAGETVSFTVEARNPANGVPFFQEAPETSNLSDADGLVFGTETLPDGAHFDAETRLFTFTPEKPGTYPITFTLDDGIIPVRRTITFTAEPGTR